MVIRVATTFFVLAILVEFSWCVSSGDDDFEDVDSITRDARKHISSLSTLNKTDKTGLPLNFLEDGLEQRFNGIEEFKEMLDETDPDAFLDIKELGLEAIGVVIRDPERGAYAGRIV